MKTKTMSAKNAACKELQDNAVDPERHSTWQKDVCRQAEEMKTLGMTDPAMFNLQKARLTNDVR